MKNNMNDRVPIKGSVTRATAEAMQRGELVSNNGLRKNFGRGSWNPEQPVFELDYGPSIGQQIAKYVLCPIIASILFEDLIPAGRYLFRTELVPFVKRKLHERLADKNKSSQIDEAETAKDASLAEESVAAPLPENIINLNDYRKAVN